MSIPKIQNEPFEIHNLDHLRKWLENEEVYRNLYILYHPKTLKELQVWYEKEKDSGGHIFKYSDKNKIIGLGLLHYIHPKNNCGEFMLITDPENARNGYGSAIITHLLYYGFEILNLHKIFFYCSEYNEAMQKIADRFEFTKEGTCRNELFYRGNYYDILRYGLLEKEYFSKK